VNPIAVARRQTAAPDGVLVQEAAAGGGASYASLYDRYATQVYNYCLRLTGSPDDAADATQGAFVNVLGRLQHDDRPVLDFASYLFAAARNESYALMRRRSRAQPTEDVPERAASVPDLETDPERAALLRDSQESVRLANAKLAPRHREVLALREVAGRSYEEIGQIMGISENGAAQLIWRARAKLKEALTAGAVASVVASSEECEIAQLLINRLQDGEPITEGEQTWLDEHLDECGSCRAARGMLLEVGTSYRAWAPVAVLATLRPDVLTQAGAVIGADWSGVASNGAGAGGGGSTAGARPPRPRGHHAAAQGVAGVAVLAAVGLAVSGLLQDDPPATRDAAPAEQGRSASGTKSSSSPSVSKADASAASVHGGKRSAAGGPPAEPGASQPAAAGPEDTGAPAPRGGSPNTSPQPRSGPPEGKQPGTGPPGKPAPKGEQPTNFPGPPQTPQPPAGPPANTDPTPPPTEPPADPTPPAPPPTVTPPPEQPPSGGPCSFPGHGNGPGGCPPGHGGTPPGHGGTPPGHGGDGPGHGGGHGGGHGHPH
jgi:RNA polymerase sigma factor (sigma-70 family)